MDAWRREGVDSYSIQSECRHTEKKPKIIKGATEYLVYRALKTLNLSNIVGYFPLNTDEQNIAGVNAKCNHSEIFTN